MNLAEFNQLSEKKSILELEKCCGSSRWYGTMVKKKPFSSLDGLLKISEKIWFELDPKDWIEAFEHHPRIGDINSIRRKFAATKEWAKDEQIGVQGVSDEILRRLSDGNQAYERKFGHVFLVCATGKSADQMLALLEQRINLSAEIELETAAQEQNKITQIRIRKLISQE